MRFVIPIMLLVVITTWSMSQKVDAQGSTPTPTAGTTVKDRDGVEMVYVPGGSVEMGISRQAYLKLCQEQFGMDEDECLKDIGRSESAFDTYVAKVRSFWIDRYEVTIKQYKPFEDGCGEYGGPCHKIDLSYAPNLIDNPDKPMVAVPWFDAMAYCNSRGARLPTEEEWEYAASGPQNNIFPWGNKLIREDVEMFKSTWPVGTKPGNVSWVGAYDMAGNAAEWVENRFQPYPTSAQEWPEGDTIEVSRVIRGGSWESGYSTLTTYRRDFRHPTSQDGSVGFRCARSSSPSNPQP